jgi:hypothetical protein
MTHILRALDNNGNEFFYTGRAGEGWVSKNVDEAFSYGFNEAKRRAKHFNMNTEIHGLRFIAYKKGE